MSSEPTFELLISEKSGVDPIHQAMRVIEALLFAAAEPLDETTIASHLGQGIHVGKLMMRLKARYEDRGVVLVQTGVRWSFRTAEDLKHHLLRHKEEPRKLSRAALEILAIIAYHQPVTRSEIEDIRGVAVSRGTLDVLMDTRWVINGPRRRDSPGRPLTYKTSPEFLSYFNLRDLDELPSLEELKSMGILDTRSILPNFDTDHETVLMERPDLQTDMGDSPTPVHPIVQTDDSETTR